MNNQNPITYYVVVDTGPITDWGEPRHAILSVGNPGRTHWKTKRIAEKHAREYKAKWFRDAWVETE